MPEHAQPHPDLGPYVLGILAADDAEVFEDHLAACSECRDEVGRLSALPSLLEQAAPAAIVPAGLEERTLAAVERAARGRRARVGVRFLAVAAALALVVVGATMIVARGGGPSSTVRLVAADGGPARGTARLFTVGGGRVVDLDVRGLAPSRPETYYECWYVESPGRAATHVTAGTFVVGTSGRAHVRMTTAADPDRYRMVVTLEREGTDGAMHGQMVLVPVA